MTIALRQPRPNILGLASLTAAFGLAASSLSAQTTLFDFQFNEGKGLTITSPTNSLVGTLGVPDDPANAPISTNDTPSGKAGDLAVQLQGAGFLLVDDSNGPILNLITNSLTIESWIKVDPNDTRQYEGIVAYGGTYKMGLNNGQLLFTLFGIEDIPSGFQVPVGEWHHVAVAWEPGVGATFYLDGTSAFVASTNMMRATRNNFLSIGAEGLSTTILATLDRVRVHKGLLTVDQLDKDAATPKAALANTVVAYDLNESAPPYQTTTSPARPATSGSTYVASTTQPTFVTDTPTGGNGDYALSFTRTSRVIVPDPNGALALDTGDFTIEAWVKFGAQPGVRSVLFFNNAAGGAIAFSVTSDRRVFVTTLGIVDMPSNAKIPDDGLWHHVACVQVTGKEFRFYVDGVLGDTVAYTSGVLIGARTDTSFYIGSESYDSLHYVGLMDRIRYTRGALPPEKLDSRAIPGIDPGAPALDITTAVQISWPTVPAGYKLQSTTNVADPNSWTLVAATPIVVGTNYNVYQPSTAAKTFYKLIKP